MQHPDPFIHMVDVLRHFYPISPAFILRLKEFVRLVRYKAGDKMLHYMQMQHYAWFAIDGAIAEINIDAESHEETTSWIWFEDNFLFTSPGFFSQQPAESCIEVLQDSRFYCISVEDFLTLKKEFPETWQLAENIRDHDQKLRNQRMIEMKLRAVKRVKKVYDMHPEIFTPELRNKLASFFCIDPDTLSRIVKQLKGIR